MLIHHAETNGHDFYFKSETKIQSKMGQRTRNFRNTKQALGDSICKYLLFVHAMLGLDTTSRVQGIGKGSILKKVSNQLFCDVADTFLQESSKQVAIKMEKRQWSWYMTNIIPGKPLLMPWGTKKFKTKTGASVALIQWYITFSFLSLVVNSMTVECHCCRLLNFVSGLK